MSKRGRPTRDSVIYKAYFATRVYFPCEGDHWDADTKYFARREDAEEYLMEYFMDIFKNIDKSWFVVEGFDKLDDTYGAYCRVFDRWLEQNQEPLQPYDYCIEDIHIVDRDDE